MRPEKDLELSRGPRVYVPPPFFYVALFMLAKFLQAKFPIEAPPFGTFAARLAGIAFIAASVLFFLFRSLRQFFASGNTVVTILPAKSLQTTGVYAFTRNPMYLGLALVYLGAAGLAGSWWTIILFPVLILIIQGYVIRREERYLAREFGAEYEAYRRRVRRWI
jgi:protein-S-isoprenylcysteine O-methyltransferase Ste14